ncbi:response regulator transcription factor [Burkholderia ambifaria]|uniref:Two component transcriptional regulator, LuxR family n=1 Tax=Burkholderia ambifaria MEX-5 TaxID=396597 RepID=B1T1G9_9BURK|nr:response regulator transcription factor [Burkholderia ambifaria]EDT42602.1 two component transcriptional regulator, LuxR family [Burkholderia ambifaria MEX-5]
MRVVIVDDHPTVQLALTSILERNVNLKVVGTASDGGEGLRLCRELKPDLLIVDIDLDGMDGIDLIQRVRIKDATVKILVFSGYSAELFALRCHAAGANGYVNKSEDVTHVLSAANAVLAGFHCFPLDINAMASGSGPHAAFAMLSERELTVLRYLAKGLSNKEIGDSLSLSNKTISTHKANILAKLGFTNVVDLAAFAKAHHLI